ncbi:MAG: hypothetical protein CMJ64_25085 [Planctomycetaceae bacterium]|nr:hypothetical protein [Planctomycetaceae bacterium]
MGSGSANGRVLHLHDIAHARSGDKGNHANIGVIAWTSVGFEFLDDFLTAEVVADFLRPLNPHRVERFRMPGIGAYNFVLHNVLAGGASRSLLIDSQGKALASALLQMEVPTPDEWEQMLKPYE